MAEQGAAATEQVSASSQQTSASVGQIAPSSQEMAQSAERLAAIFELSGGDSGAHQAAHSYHQQFDQKTPQGSESDRRFRGYGTNTV